MSGDRELLELAARAAGIELIYDDCDPYPVIDGNDEPWNPLTDDGDALRLAVKLNLGLVHGWEVLGDIPVATVWISYEAKCIAEEIKANDPYAATRRAIVRAAAEIGKGKNND